ncbi:putative oxidoreductase YrpG [Saliniradius amylolyticus]|uniref:Putative oxidoreductase YrpG n=1 Tax=Saliniradius amylolyticus TaxID=2183582 RepID=A0A2S2E695_9ALTE|nr:aldo/keto reductase [Saliniradius amylolyticus]AWL13052.1 putative oxidoreductase YrpG [Saliniradius amylolyticus]
MHYSRLGSSGLKVSRVCLGTMTWGKQNDQADADQQLGYALERGVNFIDTAELYAIPPTQDTYGATERIIGNWLERHGSARDKVIIASKIAGNGLKYIRGGSDISAKTVGEAIDGSLARLNTDYIDLYQLHWPNRTSPHFGKQWPGMLALSGVDAQQQTEQMLGILESLEGAIKAGKIRHWGLSDDTPWGIQQYLSLAEQHGFTKPVSIQNEFNLLHWKDWPYLIEQCVHSDIAYLPWSPLASGALTGKYLDGKMPEGSRWTLMANHRNGLFRDTQASRDAIRALVELSGEFDITPAQLALAWCNQVDGVVSTIIGATDMTQLKEDMDAFELTLSQEQLDAIGKILHQYPMPY